MENESYLEQRTAQEIGRRVEVLGEDGRGTGLIGTITGGDFETGQWVVTYESGGSGTHAGPDLIGDVAES